jgi:hypothetical protein
MLQMMENAFTAIIGLPQGDRKSVESALTTLSNSHGNLHWVKKLNKGDMHVAHISSDLRIFFKEIPGGVLVVDIVRGQ